MWLSCSNWTDTCCWENTIDVIEVCIRLLEINLKNQSFLDKFTHTKCSANEGYPSE